MGGEISMEDDDFEIFDEKDFKKQWEKNGMGNESMWSFFSTSYVQIVATILRPMAEQGRPGRLYYDTVKDLGSVEVDIWPITEGATASNSLKAVRQDHTMTCHGGKKIVFSIWRIKDATTSTNAKRPFVVYLHSAVGARPEALQALHTSLRAGANFVALDFQGSGLSEGNIVTWGWNENNNVVDVVRYLLKLGTATRIALWGRQLGAATALSYASRDDRVACLILDTPYSSLDDQMDLVIKTASKEGMSVPGIVLKAATTMLKRSVRKKIAHKFDPNKLAPKTFAPKCKCPALFGGDINDGVIPPDMVEKVYKKYKKKKRTLMSYHTTVGSGHFGIRPKDWSLTVYNFLLEHLYNSTKKESAGTPPTSVDPKVFDSAQWPPAWVVTLHERLEQNRSRANEAAAKAAKEKKSARSTGETKEPNAPSTDATEDMMAVVNEDAEMQAALGNLENL